MALLRILAASVISTMNVDWPRLISSLAPTRVKMRSVMPTVADFAGCETADVDHEREQRLPDERGLAAHVQAGDEPEDPESAGEGAVVRHERSRWEKLFEYRMPAIPNVEKRFLDQYRADVVARDAASSARAARKSAAASTSAAARRRGVAPATWSRTWRKSLLSSTVVLGGGLLLVFLEDRRDVALGVLERPFAYVIGGHLR